MFVSQLERIISSINDQLRELSTLLEEVAQRPETPGKDKLYDSVVAERSKLIEFYNLIYALHTSSDAGDPQAGA